MFENKHKHIIRIISIMYLVYIAAGISSRFGGTPKMLAKVGKNDERLIDISLQQALTRNDIEKIHFLVSEYTYGGILEYLGKTYRGIPISYSFQIIPTYRKKPWGTADAVASLYLTIDKEFILCNSDDLYGEESFTCIPSDNSNWMVGFQLKNAIPNKGEVNRGIVKIGLHNEIKHIEERLGIMKCDFGDCDLENTVVSMNLFKFQPEMLQFMYERVSLFITEHAEHKTKEMLLPNFLNEYVNIVDNEILCKISQSKCLGLTYQEDIADLKHEISN